MQTWYALDIDRCSKECAVDPTVGLSAADARDRLGKNGPNELTEGKQTTVWMMLWGQLSETMVVILIVAAVIAGFLGEWIDTIAIAAIVVIFAILGVVQEYRAQKALAALRRMAVPRVRVMRDSIVVEIPSRELVVGDIVLIENGNTVPADLRLVESVNLRILEASLTGESEPVDKSIDVLDGTRGIGDRINSAFMGTTVSVGRGRGIVVETGMATELGKIADLIRNVKTEPTPLQNRLDRLGKVLAIIGFACAALVAVIGVLSGKALSAMFLTGVAIAVAVVPEGLPAVVTIALALGAQRMLKRKALIRKLPAVETLGSVTVICSDKTGTLTENKMTVTFLELPGQSIDCANISKTSLAAYSETTTSGVRSLPLLLAGASLCCDAEIAEKEGVVQSVGDPTEIALVAIARQCDLDKKDLERAFVRVQELPFDSDRKRMTTVHCIDHGDFRVGPMGISSDSSHIAFTKGSVDGILDVCNSILVDGKILSIDAAHRSCVLQSNEAYAKKGMRVLGLACRFHQAAPSVPEEKDLVFVGFFAMIDPPRPEVRDAVKECRTAGIRPVMITGDHPLTAFEIARQLGIAVDGDRSMTGLELEVMSDDDLAKVVSSVSVYARVSPEHKFRIVTQLQKNGEIVAMTGDGVNDAPALTKADIGLAMGITGTDVSKDAADTVLLDDNFATIVAAVEEGRVIYDNVRKFVKFSVAGNLGKVIVMLTAPLTAMGIPLLPLQLLWLNLMTDGLMGLGLSVEQAESNVMSRPPYPPKESVFARGAALQIVWVGVLIGVIALALGGGWYLAGKSNWQTMLFSSLAFAQVFQGFAVRNGRDSLLSIGLFSNPVLSWMGLLVIVLQTAVVFVPPVRELFRIEAVSILEYGICFAANALVLIAMEIEKFFARRRGV